MGNNPMVGATVSIAVAVEEAMKQLKIVGYRDYRKIIEKQK